MKISRAKILRLSWTIQRRDGLPRAQAMKRAWAWAKKQDAPPAPAPIAAPGTLEAPKRAPPGMIAPPGPVDPRICWAPSPRCQCVQCRAAGAASSAKRAKDMAIAGSPRGSCW